MCPNQICFYPQSVIMEKKLSLLFLNWTVLGQSGNIGIRKCIYSRYDITS